MGRGSVFCWLFALLISPRYIDAGWESYEVIPMMFAACKDSNPKRALFNITLRKESHQPGILYANGTIRLTNALKAGTTVHNTLFKCMAGADSSGCKSALTMVADFCTLAFKKNQFWTKWVDTIENFPQACPVPAGSYEFQNMPLDMMYKRPWETVPMPERFVGPWMTVSKYTQDKQVEVCVEAIVEIRKKRRASKKSNKGGQT